MGMNNFWERYWKWSDKINAPFQRNKDRIILYVVLCQSVIVTFALLRLASGGNKIQMICVPDPYHQQVICMQQ
jgi:phage-related protein